MTMKLYSWDISPYAARVRMQIYAKGLTDIAIEQTPFFLTQKFYEDRPLSRIPSLEVDGDAIPESAVIAEYLEEIYPEPSLLGSTPRENAHIRTLARIGDVYLMSTAFTLASQTRILAAQTPVPTGIESIVALLSGQLASSIRTLDRMIGRDGFACLGHLTLADCALVPSLSYVQHMLLNRGLADPIAANVNVAAYLAAIQGQEPAARVLAERENSADLLGGVPLADKGALAPVLLDATQSEIIGVSAGAAERVVDALGGVGEIRKPQVQRAGFVVLKSLAIPSMLVETAYISNPTEERRLRSSEQQARLADAIAGGVRSYFLQNPPDGTRFKQEHLSTLASAAETKGAAATP